MAENKDNSKTIGLRKTLGPVGGISLIVGNMIGSGIFASARWVMVYSGSAGMTLLAWSGCGLLAILGALSYIELGLSIPRSGCEHAYLGEAYGDIAAFLFSWTTVLVNKPASLAIILLTFASYTIEAFFPGCGGDPDFIPLTKLLAASAIGKIRVKYSMMQSALLQVKIYTLFT